MTQQEFLTQAFDAAKAAGHIFPDWAACEAARDSNFGTTDAATKGNNLFNFRVPAKRGPGLFTVTIPNAKAAWTRLAFNNWTECFAYRAKWFENVTMFYLAKRAKTGEEYIRAMQKLANSPAYSQEVTAIHSANEELFHEHVGSGS